MCDISESEDLEMLKLKSKIMVDDINSFNISSRGENDSKNKMRERIVQNIINNTIPSHYFDHERWYHLREEIHEFYSKLSLSENIIITSVKCNIKAGRGNCYDFDFVINEKTDNLILSIEWKFNAKTIQDTPQISSPYNLSQYLNKNYERHHYNNYLAKILEGTDIEIPDEETYMKEVHLNKSKSLKVIQDNYYKGCKKSSKFTGKEHDIEYYKKLKKLSKESIQSFMENAELNCSELSKYLQEKQKDKIYMLYKNGKINLQKINSNDYRIISCEKNIKLQCFITTCVSGLKLKIMLRWKNGHGIALPAFQISILKGK